jgi:hypothetical protein
MPAFAALNLPSQLLACLKHPTQVELLFTFNVPFSLLYILLFAFGICMCHLPLILRAMFHMAQSIACSSVTASCQD